MTPIPGMQGDGAQDAESGEERADVRTGARALHHETPENERARDVTQGRKHVERRKHPEAERDADDRDHHEHGKDRTHDADQRTPPDRRPEPPPGSHGGVRGTREQQHEQQAEEGDPERDRDP